ncbi:MAG: hypothetical protein Q7L55_11495 [Actinomycetota bacterium]|nr:hypothetical protein [Actinomycetota bacterium]
MKRMLVVIAAAGLLAACSSTSTEPTASSSATSGSEPSAALIAWADQVCTDTSTLQSSITDIGTAVTSGGTDLQTSIAQQFILIQQAGQELATTVGTIPDTDTSGANATAIQQSSDDLNSAVAALGTSIAGLKDASGIDLASALLSVGSSAAEAGQAAIDNIKAIDAAIKDRSAAIGKAFEASPSCAALTTDKQ